MCRKHNSLSKWRPRQVCYRCVRAVLFCLPPELAHLFVMTLLSYRVRWTPWRYLPAVKARVQLWDLSFSNRVGIAAGFDKDGRYLPVYPYWGAGFVELGTVTPQSQMGNPKPRLFRLVKDQALVNRMGFNNCGVGALVKGLKANTTPLVVGVNLGKQRETELERAADDYLYGLRLIYTAADYVTLNISSPNTPGLTTLQQHQWLADFISPIIACRNQLATVHGRVMPLLVKLSPDLQPQALETTVGTLVDKGIDGFVVANTTVSRQGLKDKKFQSEIGGLSGGPLTVKAFQQLQQVRQLTQLPIISVGGIMSAEQARTRIDAGATLIQLYTGIIYQGPGLIRDCVKAIG